MQKILAFAQNHDLEVKKETISGVLLHFLPVQADGTTICTLADFNKVSVDIFLERKGQEPKAIVQGYLEDILVGLYSQSTKFELNKTKRTNGYLVMLDLTPARIVLNGEDILRVKIKAENIAFTSLSAANSSIYFETIPAFGGQTAIPVLRMYPIGNGESIVDKEVGDSVVKITLATDLTTDYLASSKAKPVSVDVFANGYEKSVSESLVVAENIHYLDYNPDSAVQDLVLYTGAPLNSVRVKAKLNPAADSTAKVMVVALQNI